MRIGIFFGGTSREREISFAGGRTVFDNLDKALFQPVPIFVDSLGHFILLDWQYIYKGTIRDFYPPVSAQPATRHPWQVYIENLGELSEHDITQLIAQVGREIKPHELPLLMDFAFLALHGPGGEDGRIQGMLEWLGLPYSGSGILPSAIGIDKIAQKRLMQAAGLATPKFRVLDSAELMKYTSQSLLDELVSELGLPLVMKAPHQGSSIGISILREADPDLFWNAYRKSMFHRIINREEWEALDEKGRLALVRQLSDIREGIGLPVTAQGFQNNEETASLGVDSLLSHSPESLYDFLATSFPGSDFVRIESVSGETQVLVEQFIAGREFSCIVIEDEKGQPLALPPTEIVKGDELFDYRSKYLPGLARKVTPINLPEADIERIRQQCQDMFRTFGFEVYARLDGFIQADGTIFLNDPNTTSGMLPASFFFHQAAEIGLNPSQFLTYIILHFAGGPAARRPETGCSYNGK